MAILGFRSSDDKKRDQLKAAEQAAIKNANESIRLAQEQEGKLRNEYQGLIDRGLGNFNAAYAGAGDLFRNQVPQFQNLGDGGLSDVYQNYSSNLYQPEFQNYQAAVYNEDPTNTDQYQALMGASADYGGDLAGGLANRYNYDIAQRDFNNQLAQNELGMQSNRYLNDVNNQALAQGMGLENYLQQLNQTNYDNQVGQYGAERQQFADALGQYNWLNNIGSNARTRRNSYDQDVLSAQIGNLTGQTNATMSNLANQMMLESQKQSNFMNALGSAGNALGSYFENNPIGNPFSKTPETNNSITNYDWNQYSDPFGKNATAGISFDSNNAFGGF